MSTLEVRLEGREHVAAGTIAFHFSKPPGFSFEAGQAIDLILGDASTTSVQNARHAFSIVSAPTEPRLTITTRMRYTAFKRALGALASASTTRLEGPFVALLDQATFWRPLRSFSCDPHTGGYRPSGTFSFPCCWRSTRRRASQEV